MYIAITATYDAIKLIHLHEREDADVSRMGTDVRIYNHINQSSLSAQSCAGLTGSHHSGCRTWPFSVPAQCE